MEDVMLLSVEPGADLLDQSARIVRYYYEVEEDIRRICRPFFNSVPRCKITQAQVDAARALADYLPVCILTAHLLANMFYENNC